MRDRLASYVYFEARECLDQAMLVGQRQEIDFDLVREWAQKECAAMEKAVAKLEELLGR